MAKKRPEDKVRASVCDFMTSRGWGFEITHGNQFQSGLPDALFMHPEIGSRWVDFKVPGKYSFTKAQKVTWPTWYFKYLQGVWILTWGCDDEYAKLFEPANFLDYWKWHVWGDPEAYIHKEPAASLLDSIDDSWSDVLGFPQYEINDSGIAMNKKSKRQLLRQDGGFYLYRDQQRYFWKDGHAESAPHRATRIVRIAIGHSLQHDTDEDEDAIRRGHLHSSLTGIPINVSTT